MNTIVILILFLGVFFITHGIYEQKIGSMNEKEKIVYKFVPRTYYEEQLQEANLDEKMFDLYNKDSPWMQKAVGSKIDLPKKD
jgi:hypothetical protein